MTGWRLRAATSLATACTLALVLSATGVSFAARGAARPAAARPVYGGTLNLDTQSQPHTLDPARSEDVVSAQMTYLLFNTLVTYAPTSTRLVPSLATRWQVSDHGRTYTFWLRHGVTFSNGDPFDAADVVYTFTRVNEAATDAPYQSSFANIEGGAALFSGKAKSLPGIRAVGPYEVVMHLVQPEPYWLNVVALPSAAIVDPRVASAWNAELTGKNPKPIDPVGTGPFILQPYGASPTQYVFVRNPHYFVKGLPYLDRIIIHIGAPPQLQLEQFERGQIGAMPSFLENTSLDSSQYLQVRANPKLRADYIRTPDNGVEYLFFNVNQKPFNNLYLREAIADTINKRYLTVVLTNGRGRPANSILPPAMPGYDPAINLFPQAGTAAGIRDAKALLIKAGYPHGVNIGSFWIIQGAGDTDWGSVVSSELAAVGIKVTPKIVGFSTYITAVLAGKAGFAMTFWTQDYPDPQDFMFNLFDGQQVGNDNFSRIDLPAVNALIGRADSLSRMAARIPLYRKAEVDVLRTAAVIPIYYMWQDGLVAANVYPKTPAIWLHPVQPAELDRVWIR